MFKDSVRFKIWTHALDQILDTLLLIDEKKYEWMPLDIIVTSVNDSQHMLTSRHYKNEAIDVRSHNFKNEENKYLFIEKLNYYLGPKFTVLYESIGQPNEHFHIQVKKGEVYP